MKRSIISLILVIAMAFSLSIPAFAVGTERVESFIDSKVMSFVEAKIYASGYNVKANNVKNLLDFGGNEYKLVECIPSGYYIVHPESGIIVESSPSAKSPYDGLESNIYYGGPTYYYLKSGDNYIHTVLDTIIDNSMLNATAETCNRINNELISKTNKIVASYFKGDYSEAPPVAYRAGIDYWVTSYDWFQDLNSGFGYKTGGYCGYIAANLILKYFDNRGKIDLPSAYSQIDSIALTNELVDIGDALGYGAATYGYDIADIINEFCLQEGLPEEANWAVAGYGLTTEIGTNKRPCIIFGNLQGAGNHAVVAYGYNIYENPGYDTFVCHFGWNEVGSTSYSEVHIYAGYSIYGANVKYKV